MIGKFVSIQPIFITGCYYCNFVGGILFTSNRWESKSATAFPAEVALLAEEVQYVNEDVNFGEWEREVQ